jgi:hypothetical protein
MPSSNSPEASKDLFAYDEKGTKWLRTGDIVEINDKGFIAVTDRLKELIKVRSEGAVDIKELMSRSRSRACKWRPLSWRITWRPIRTWRMQRQSSARMCTSVLNCHRVSAHNRPEEATEVPRAYGETVRCDRFD